MKLEKELIKFKVSRRKEIIISKHHCIKETNNIESPGIQKLIIH